MDNLPTYNQATPSPSPQALSALLDLDADTVPVALLTTPLASPVALVTALLAAAVAALTTPPPPPAALLAPSVAPDTALLAPTVAEETTESDVGGYAGLVGAAGVFWGWGWVGVGSAG